MNKKSNGDSNVTKTYDACDTKYDESDMDVDSSMNDVWVDFLLKTGSIIELNALMDQTYGIEKDWEGM